MSALPARAWVPYAQFEQLREAREILRLEAEALQQVAQRLDAEFCAAVTAIAETRGRVVVTGIGKAGLIGRKLTATFCSLGTRALFLHPAEAIHGDLGMIDPDDLVLILSNSGETEEICRLLPTLQRWGNRIIALTGREQSTLTRAADIRLIIGRLREADPHALAPTVSTTAMLAVGDALAIVVSRMRQFTPRDFAQYHPGGSLGQQLLTVREMMRTGDQLRIAPETQTIREILASFPTAGRRTGAVILVDEQGLLSGLFTDSDLVKLLERRREGQLDRPIQEVMTQRPYTIQVEALLSTAIDLLSAHHLSELPVVDAAGIPVGLLDITDLIGIRDPQSVAP